MVYIHIPYCRSHCTYCTFYSELLPCRRGSETVSDELLERYVEAVCREIDSEKLRGGALNTLYVGGGTPSLLSISQLGKLVGAVEALAPFDEFTVEVNPDDIVHKGKEYCLGLKTLGVTRISMGIQSFDNVVLQKMGRRHDAAEAVEAFALLRGEGFNNISVDLIFGFTSDFDVSAIKQGLETLARVSPDKSLPEHISCYQLSVEEGCGLEIMSQKGLFSMPDDETCAVQYYALCKLLQELGYEHYEISNWARSGFRSIHNGGYWTHEPYLGFGPSAHSLLIEKDENGGQKYIRRWNSADVKAYLAATSFDSVRGEERLTDEQLRIERLMLRLRTKEGDAESGVVIPEDKWFIADSIIAAML